MAHCVDPRYWIQWVKLNTLTLTTRLLALNITIGAFPKLNRTWSLASCEFLLSSSVQFISFFLHSLSSPETSPSKFFTSKHHLIPMFVIPIEFSIRVSFVPSFFFSILNWLSNTVDSLTCPRGTTSFHISNTRREAIVRKLCTLYNYFNSRNT